MTEENKELDRKDLKILAYKDKLSTLEEENADLRVEVTVLDSQLRAMAEHVSKLESSEGEEGNSDSGNPEE